MKRASALGLFAIAATLMVLGLFAFRRVLAKDGEKKHSVTITWNASAGAEHYNVYRAEKSGGPYERIGSSKKSEYVDDPVPGGVTLYYVVTSVKGTNESRFSSEIKAKVP